MSVRGRSSPRVAVRLDCSSEASRTKQSMRDECDINLILSRFVKTGAIAHQAKFGGSYGFAEPMSFHEAMNIIRQGEEMFYELPAVLRKRFSNDVGSFLQYVQNPENLPEMRKLGLAEAEKPKPAEPPPMKVEVVNPPSPAKPA